MSSDELIQGALAIAQILLGCALVCTLLRLLRGPRAQDRVLALDTLYVNAMILMLTLGMRDGSAVYFEAALTIALLGFVATVALAKFLLRGEVIE
jgi:multicomponent K+:H+ antiporter subunit F